jgi:Rps23 Pro-64 3,4-dihydroxylase Tpa1-like proline 4-hydroxylase
MKGGGVHYTLPGGVLRVHADFTKHPAYPLDRRLNLLLYMNPIWEDAWGGHLDLWTADMQTCVASHPPIANRCVIFSTTATSFHGHPHPLSCPEGMFRRSLAAYYYTSGRPEHEVPESGIQTLWQDLPTEKK